jgi:hypothetical protein
MYPWDGMHDPRYFEWLLLPLVPLPAMRRMKEAFIATGQGGYAERPSAHVPTSGPAVLRVSTLAAGDLSDELKRRLSEIGRVGAVIVNEDLATLPVEVDAIETARPAAEALLGELGMRDDAIVDICPVAGHEPS